jgi:hypothetical protein
MVGSPGPPAVCRTADWRIRAAGQQNGPRVASRALRLDRSGATDYGAGRWHITTPSLIHLAAVISSIVAWSPA